MVLKDRSKDKHTSRWKARAVAIRGSPLSAGRASAPSGGSRLIQNLPSNAYRYDDLEKNDFVAGYSTGQRAQDAQHDYSGSSPNPLSLKTVYGMWTNWEAQTDSTLPCPNKSTANFTRRARNYCHSGETGHCSGNSVITHQDVPDVREAVSELRLGASAPRRIAEFVEAPLNANIDSLSPAILMGLPSDWLT